MSFWLHPRLRAGRAVARRAAIRVSALRASIPCEEEEIKDLSALSGSIGSGNNAFELP